MLKEEVAASTLSSWGVEVVGCGVGWRPEKINIE
jgi:hypothetical protein